MRNLQAHTPAEPLDLALIEAEAHRLRAETLREGVAWLVARVTGLWSRPAANGTRAA